MEKCFKHTPVLLKECISNLNIKSNGIYVDGTFGGGGHSKEILKKLTNGKLIGIDKDDDALKNAKETIKSNNLILVKNDFKNIKSILQELNIEKVDGILLDLGVSSYQLDTSTRGFSYRFDGPLDMRMDTSQKLKAYDVVNSYSESDLLKILYEYGEESNAKIIVKAIIKQRQIKPIESTKELSDLIEAHIKSFGNKSNATKTFQAIRIEVNKELIGLEECVHNMIDILNPLGRLLIITFHSLEDKLVKKAINIEATNCICDKSLPICVCNHNARIKLINKKPIIATTEELINNKRSSSAKLRVIEKI